jgi:hypothetical protein
MCLSGVTSSKKGMSVGKQGLLSVFANGLVIPSWGMGVLRLSIYLFLLQTMRNLCALMPRLICWPPEH